MTKETCDRVAVEVGDKQQENPGVGLALGMKIRFSQT